VFVTSRCFHCVDVQARGSGSSGSGSNSSSNKTSSPDDDQVIGPSTLAATCVPAVFCECMSVYYWHLDDTVDEIGLLQERIRGTLFLVCCVHQFWCFGCAPGVGECSLVGGSNCSMLCVCSCSLRGLDALRCSSLLWPMHVKFHLCCCMRWALGIFFCLHYILQLRG